MRIHDPGSDLRNSSRKSFLFYFLLHQIFHVAVLVVHTQFFLSLISEDSIKSEDSSLYGYAGEVVLICLTVLFLLLFIVMVVKYHLLKTRFGGYDVGEPGQGRSNPGYEVQMSYRDEN